MKKYFLLSAVGLAAIFILPQAARAQWTDPYQTYRMNGIIINGTKKNTVRKKVVKKKTVRRKAKTAVRPTVKKAAAINGVSRSENGLVV